MSNDSSLKPLIKIGKITDAHAMAGMVKVHLFSKEAPWLSKAKTLFLGEPKVEYVIERTSLKREAVMVKLKGVDHRTAAEGLHGQEVFILEELLKTKKGESIYLREVLGFKIISEGKEVGEVIGFSTNGAQDLLVVRPTGKNEEVLIPLIKEFLVKISHGTQTIEMNLPQGLLEINHAF